MAASEANEENRLEVKTSTPGNGRFKKEKEEKEEKEKAALMEIVTFVENMDIEPEIARAKVKEKETLEMEEKEAGKDLAKEREATRKEVVSSVVELTMLEIAPKEEEKGA